jgi:hypothetical protein
LGVLIVVAWALYPGSEPPRLVVTALDVVGHDADLPNARAWLDPQDAGDAPKSLEGYPVFFWVDKAGPNADGAQQRVGAAASGEASASLPFAKLKTHYHVRLLDPRKKYEREDGAHAFVLARESRILLVEVEETLADVDSASWSKTNPLNIAVRAGAVDALQAAHAKQKYVIVYLALGNAPAREYRRVRGWLRNKAATPPALPDGPVLGRLRYDSSNTAEARQAVLADLRQRFPGELAAVVRTSEAAEQCVALGIRAFAMGGGDFPPEVTALMSWQELPAALGK